MSALRSAPRLAWSAGGAILAAGTRAVASVRPARKPLHPAGEVRDGRVFRSGSPEPTGVPWLDEPGEDDAVVRLSRAIGLPERLPDIYGLALRVRSDEGQGDLLFATTGWGRLSRFVLTPSRQAHTRPLTTLLPYRTESGPVLIGAHGLGGDAYELAWARPTGPWRVFGVLRLSLPGDDAPISFDPVRHQIAGLEQYPGLARLREPAYLTARRSRDDSTGTTTRTFDPDTEEHPHVH